MASISGVDLPREKRVEIALTYIYGIGEKTAKDIIKATGVNPDTRVKDLTEEDVAKLREYIDHNVQVEGDLRRETALDIKRLIEIGCYRGIRHRKGLPVRGQRSKTNARTRKGPKRTVANKKKYFREGYNWLLKVQVKKPQPHVDVVTARISTAVRHISNPLSTILSLL